MQLDLRDIDLRDKPGFDLRSDLESRVDAEADRFLSVAVTLCVLTIMFCLLIAALL